MPNIIVDVHCLNMDLSSLDITFKIYLYKIHDYLVHKITNNNCQIEQTEIYLLRLRGCPEPYSTHVGEI